MGDKNKRKQVSKSIRFEVFKRDSFSCQYCGRSAPEVLLHIDHISPIVSGGDNELTNLITSCIDCNLGKGARELSDNSVIQKQKKQLEELNERRVQLEMMLEWRQGLAGIDDRKISEVIDHFKMIGIDISEHGLNELKKWIKKFDFEILLDSLEASFSQYLKDNGEGAYTLESVQKAFSYIPRIAIIKTNGEKPHMRDVFYVRAILKNTIRYYYNDHQAIKIIETAYLSGVPIEELKQAAKESTSWTKFKNRISSLMEYFGGNNAE